MFTIGTHDHLPAMSSTRPLREVLAEHVDQVAAARRQALEQLAENALPADAPGAWIRNAIDAKLAAACYVCGGDSHPDGDPAQYGHKYWPTADAERELAAEAQRHQPAGTPERRYVDQHRPY